MARSLAGPRRLPGGELETSFTTPATSSSDRCIFIKPLHNGGLERPAAVEPQGEIARRTRRKLNKAPKKLNVTLDWRASESATPDSVGLLDLPRELREMIYQYVCADLKREGLRWEDTVPLLPGEPARTWPSELLNHSRDTYIAHISSQAPRIFSYTSIMRTCIQVHAEFAPLLYSVPIQLDSKKFQLAWLESLPISELYAPLIRSILHTNMTNHKFLEPKTWEGQLRVATALHRTFPNATIRLGWYVYACHCDSETGIAAELWESVITRQVQIFRDLVAQQDDLEVSRNLEIVYLKGKFNLRRTEVINYAEVLGTRCSAGEAVRVVQGTSVGEGK